MKTNLKAFAVASTTESGVTFHLLPFRNIGVDVREAELNAITPHFRYTHKETGEQAFLEPLAHQLAVIRKAESDWEVEDLWSVTHRNFVAVDSVTEAIDFPAFDEATDPDVRALAAYWQGTYANTAERWEAYQALISTPVSNLWVEAYQATRPKAPAAPQPPSATKEKAKASSRRSNPLPSE